MPTILLSIYAPADKRTDDANWLIGDTTYVVLSCGHWMHGSSHTHYRPGDTVVCQQCRKLA